MQAHATTSPARWYLHLGFVACVFLTIWGAKLLTIGRYGTDVPYWDQWAKEGEFFYAPWYERHEFWKPLFVPHNEHRIAPTLAMNLGLVELGGRQWDARVQCAASAAVHALLGVLLAVWALRHLGRSWGVACAATIIVAAAAPIAWDNVLGGFQSQFHFLALFSVLAIAGLLGSRPFSWAWFGGITAVLLATVSMGSGFLVSGSIAAVAAFRLVGHLRAAPAASSGDAERRAACGAEGKCGIVATLAAALVLGGVGLWLRPEAPWHAPFHAHSVKEYLLYAIRCLAWPLYEQPWFAALSWSPWAVLAMRTLRDGGPDPIGSPRALPDQSSLPYVPSVSPHRSRPSDELILAAGLWILLQIAAVSYSRAGASSLPASRYGDTFALGLILNGFALARLITLRGATTARHKTLLLGAFSVWFLAAVASIALATRTVVENDLPRKKAESVAYEQSVRAFVATNDYAAFEKATLPFPSAEWLARIIRNPTLRPLLPASVSDKRTESLLSKATRQLSANAGLLLFPALLGAFLFGWWLTRPQSAPPTGSL